MNINVLFKVLAVSSMSMMLSGCFSIMLAMNSTPTSSLEKWKSDTVTGLSLAQDSDGNKGYVFVGKTFDYLLTAGGDEVVKLLKDPSFNRQNLEVVDQAEFIIRSSSKLFDGALRLKYTWKTEEEKQKATDYGFACSSRYCVKSLPGLRGTIHKKNKSQDYSQVLTFYHPFDVAFYERKSSLSVGKVLAPFAVTLDIVTSPLQIIGLGLYTGMTQ